MRKTAEARPPAARQIAVGIGLLVAVALVAWAGSQASAPNVDGWYAGARKVPWDPPNAVFGPVWSLLYLLIALAGWLIWRAGYRPRRPNGARSVLAVFAGQLVLNALWTPVFFAGYEVVGPAAWWIALAIILALIAAVVWLGIAAVPWSPVASWITIPYLLWLIFATSLNIGIITLN